MLRETLTDGERNLAEAGKTEEVLATRAAYQELIKADAIKLVETTLYRKVAGFMSVNHLEPDLAAEVFVLEPIEDGAPKHELQEADDR
jgi:hypothetical protein